MSSHTGSKDGGVCEGASDGFELFGVSSSRSAALRGTGQEGTPKRACAFLHHRSPNSDTTAQLNNFSVTHPARHCGSKN